jgi:hypothetical protein
MHEDLPKFLGASGAAKILGVSIATVHALCDRQQLPCERTDTGRRVFRLEDVQKVAAQRAGIAPARTFSGRLRFTPAQAEQVVGEAERRARR